MPRLEYAGIEIKVLHVAGYQRKAIYEGPDYLYTRYTIHVRGWFNPKATSYNLPAIPGSPVAEDGHIAAITDTSIRHRLLQPRQQLYFYEDHGDAGVKAFLLVSPQPLDVDLPEDEHFETDANNGPFPLDCNVSQVIGTKTFMVDFVIQTDINECQLAVSSPPTVLSHLWEMTDDIDEQFLTTRRIAGKIVFSTHRLHDADPDEIADDYRGMIVHPVGPFMKRVSVKVKVIRDGTAAEYEITDREQVYNIGEKANQVGVVKIEGEHLGVVHNQLSVDDAIIRGAALTADILDPSNFSGQRFRSSAELVLQLVPRFTHRVVARVWGTRNALKRDLEAAAYTVIFTRLSQAAIFTSAYRLGVLHHLHASYVEASCEYTTGPAGAIFDIIGQVAGGEPILVPHNENIPGVLTTNVIDNPNLPSSDNSRGTFFQQLITAALLAPCQNIDNSTPPTPPNRD